MAVANPHVKFRYQDYKSLPESETRRYELLDGELLRVPSPAEYHQRISHNLALALGLHVAAANAGRVYAAPLDVVLGEGDAREVVQPDLFVILAARAGIIAETEIRGAPDLVVEILSPASAERDRTYKRSLYARHGAREYWLVDPATRTVEVLGLRASGLEPVAAYAGDGVLASPLLDGLAIELSQVF